MSDVRDANDNVSDRTLVVGVSSVDGRRAHNRASRAASESRSAEDSALLALATADGALYEAQFGSIAAGRISAGTITAAVSMTSPQIIGGGGTVELGPAGIEIVEGAVTKNNLRFVDSFGGALMAGLGKRANFPVMLDSIDGVQLVGGPTSDIEFDTGGEVRAQGSLVLTEANFAGQTDGTTYTGGNSHGPNYTSNREASDYPGTTEVSTGDVAPHVHSVPPHSHTVTV